MIKPFLSPLGDHVGWLDLTPSLLNLGCNPLFSFGRSLAKVTLSL